MRDPKYKGPGFYDINDVESIIRAITDDAGMRLFNSIQVREGKQDATAQIERDLHVCIMAKHRYSKHPFRSVKELVKFVMDYKPQDESQECMKSIILNRIPELKDANEAISSNSQTTSV